MKIGEEFIDGDGDTFHIKQTFDPNPTLKSLEMLRESGLDRMGESVHVGRVPGWLITEWLKEAGVKWSDTKARDEVVKRKMMSGDFSKFRNWQGTY